MNRMLQSWSLSLFCVSAGFTSSGQVATLHTADARIVVEPGSAPRLVSLQIPGHSRWDNVAVEPLIEAIEMDGKSTPIHWQFNRDATRVDEQQVSFVYESASPHLRLTWQWRAPVTFGPIEHQIRIENLESQEIWIPLQESLVFNWRIDPKASLEHLYVEKGANTPSPVGTHLVALTAGYRWTGTSSTYGDLRDDEPREIIPWSLVQSKDSAQAGWYAGIEFSGRTRISMARDKDSLRGSIGLNPDPGPFRTRLAPGEVFETPVVFLGGFRDGPDGAGNVLRRWVRAALGNPETWKDQAYPLTVNNSWGGGMDINEAVARRMIRDSAGLGLEMFHIDAGWFRDVGDWYPNPQKFPHGLVPIADEAHKNGLKFGLWVDWTQAGLSTKPGTLNARDPKVRDWMVTDLPKDWQPEPFKGQTIDLSVPEAKQWAQREVERIVTDYHLDMLEHDGYLVARGCDRTDHPHAAPDPLNKCVYKMGGSYWVDSSNSTDVSYHAVRAYYDIHSKLRKDHPGLLLEVCDDGGRMVDFGSAAHADYFSVTDTYDPLSNRRGFYDTSHVLPPAMLETYVEKWPTPRMENFRYMLRSGMMGWLTIMIDTSTWSADQHAEARKEIAMYKKELRPLIRDGSLYHVSPRPDGVHWDGVQYWDPDRKRGVVYAFRGTVDGEIMHSFVLKGLELTRRYTLRFHDHSAPDRTATGRELMSAGLKVTLPLQNTSELIFVQPVE
jgi:hypothetical protein